MARRPMMKVVRLAESRDGGSKTSKARKSVPISLALLIIIFLLLLAAAMVYYATPKSGFPGTKAIADRPEIQRAIENKMPIMVYFSSAGCPTCLMQDRAISAVFPKYESVVEFAYILLENSTEKVFEEWSVVKVPTIVFVDRNGVIVSRFDGRYLDEEALRTELERVK
ncbi:MAG: thioredoxin family protein [Candidatus Methanomethylicaceae archaeon]